MRERPRRAPEHTAAQAQRQTVDVSWRSWLRLLGVIAFAWLLQQLWHLVLVVLVAVLLAIALEPVVAWLERKRVPRGLGAVLVAATLVGITALFVELSWASLADQGRVLSERGQGFYDEALRRMPWLSRFAQGGPGNASALSQYAVRFVQSLASAAVVSALGLILMVYLLVDGRRTWAWVRAFVPERHRARTDETARATREVVSAYVVGNVLTSVFAAGFVFVALSLLRVPASLVLALLAGIFDFVPVLGFALSSAPAILLALTVSGPTALLVAALYVAYHLIENYLIAPKVYGDRLCLSDLAVLLAFAVGAQLAGVIGALIALPLAAAYPTIERLWLVREVGAPTVEEHRRIERAPR